MRAVGGAGDQIRRLVRVLQGRLRSLGPSFIVRWQKNGVFRSVARSWARGDAGCGRGGGPNPATCESVAGALAFPGTVVHRPLAKKRGVPICSPILGARRCGLWAGRWTKSGDL